MVVFVVRVGVLREVDDAGGGIYVCYGVVECTSGCAAKAARAARAARVARRHSGEGSGKPCYGPDPACPGYSYYA